MDNSRPITVTTTDQFSLYGTLFEPAASNQRFVLINSAMAVKRAFYAKYAAYLAGRGFTVLTYDYRGIGESRPASLRGFKAQLWQWGALDFAAVVQWIRAQYPDDKLLAVGHSMGGQVLGLTPESQHITAFLGVTVTSAYWKWWTGFPRWRLFFLMHIWIPKLILLLGYVPGRAALGEDLPAGIAWDWARGGRSPQYIYDLYGHTEHDYFGQFTAPFLAYSFSDDSYAPRAAVESMLSFYPNAPIVHKHLKPSDVGAPSIGHFGFFRSKMEATLWAESTEWLTQQ
jgi:predicted alpha/beta hydrolase